MTFSSFHTHTCYDDGKDSPEELVEAALEKRFSALGFSGHAYAPYDTDCCMTPEGEREYRRGITALKKKYAGKIRIYCGIERDFFAPSDGYVYDYTIGSVHYVRKNGEYIPVDLSAEALEDGARRHFGGDIYALTEEYYALVSKVVEKTRCDIIGHFDLIAKFSEISALFDTENLRYTSAAEKAAEALCRSGALFEINTGAISRGYRTSPYPAANFIRLIAGNGGKFVLNSDCHDKNFLDCRFAEVLERYGDTAEIVNDLLFF